MPRSTPPGPEARPPRERPPRGALGAFSGAMGEAAPYVGLGLQLALSMLLFLGLGVLADRWLGTAPWLLIVGAALGMVASGVYLYRVVQELEARRRPPREGPKKP